MMPLLIFLLVMTALILLGLWRRFGPVQWIWLLFGAAFTLLVIWALVLFFYIGPEMIRMGPP